MPDIEFIGPKGRRVFLSEYYVKNPDGRTAAAMQNLRPVSEVIPPAPESPPMSTGETREQMEARLRAEIEEKLRAELAPKEEPKRGPGRPKKEQAAYQAAVSIPAPDAGVVQQSMNTVVNSATINTLANAAQ